jgi:hypothetical protein
MTEVPEPGAVVAEVAEVAVEKGQRDIIGVEVVIVFVVVAVLVANL